MKSTRCASRAGRIGSVVECCHRTVRQERTSRVERGRLLLGGRARLHSASRDSHRVTNENEGQVSRSVPLRSPVQCDFTSTVVRIHGWMQHSNFNSPV